MILLNRRPSIVMCGQNPGYLTLDFFPYFTMTGGRFKNDFFRLVRKKIHDLDTGSNFRTEVLKGGNAIRKRMSVTYHRDARFFFRQKRKSFSFDSTP